jgi:hypothetical protein
MEDINRMKLHMKILLIGLALLAIMIALHYNLGTFQSAPADPTCPRGRYSKRTGGICTGPPSNAYDDGPAVLDKPASIKYPEWALDPSTSTDINTDAEVSDWQFRSFKGLDDSDLISKRSPKSPYDYRYDTSLNSAGHSLEDVYDSSYDTEKKYNQVRKNRPSVEELEEKYNKKRQMLPHSEDDYTDNRLSRDYKSRERQFDLPSSSSYNTHNTQAYDSSCTAKSYQDEDEVCEGFSPLL